MVDIFHQTKKINERKQTINLTKWFDNLDRFCWRWWFASTCTILSCHTEHILSILPQACDTKSCIRNNEGFISLNPLCSANRSVLNHIVCDRTASICFRWCPLQSHRALVCASDIWCAWLARNIYIWTGIYVRESLLIMLENNKTKCKILWILYVIPPPPPQHPEYSLTPFLP